MAKLTSTARKNMAGSEFALPDRRYPIPDASHARNALARAAGNAAPSEQLAIQKKVKRKFPKIAVHTGIDSVMSKLGGS